jgi:hypothetical protein
MPDMNADKSEVGPENENENPEIPTTPEPDRAESQGSRPKPAPGRMPARASRTQRF